MSHKLSKKKKNDESDCNNPFVVDTVKQVYTATIPIDSQWMVNLSLKELRVPLKLDTGNDVNIMPISYYKKLQRKPEIKSTKIRLILTLAVYYQLQEIYIYYHQQKR